MIASLPLGVGLVIYTLNRNYFAWGTARNADSKFRHYVFTMTPDMGYKSWNRCTIMNRIVRREVLLIFFIAITFFFVNFLRESWSELMATNTFLSHLPPNLESSPVTDEESCKCQRPLSKKNITQIIVSSTCDTYSMRRGRGQNVTAFSLYGDLSSVLGHGFFLGISKNVELLEKFYPGWTMRVYHSLDTKNSEVLGGLCKLWCENPSLDFCQVGKLPWPLGDLSRIHGMVWRFLVLGDPLVDRFVVRDLDCLFTQREADAVNEWISSNRSWHSMRDNPNHNKFLVGGLWGGMNRDLELTRELRSRLVDAARNRFRKDFDQVLLERHVWPLVRGDCLSHDSFLCEDYTFSKPWPSKRLKMQFVGEPIAMTDLGVEETGGQLPECPYKCRPDEHKDWLYC